MSQNTDLNPHGLISKIVEAFLASRLSIIMVVASLCLGIAAIMVTPREEEPQIVVPMADVYVQAPGASAAEVEKLVATPLEKLLWQIDGVEYVYSTSYPDKAVVTVRFYVGENREDSLLKLYNKIYMNTDIVPYIVKGWVVKPVEIDDVPIVNITLHSDRYGPFELRRVGEEVLARLSEVKDISSSEIVGGLKREVRVELSPQRLAGYGLSSQEVSQAIAGGDASITAGSYFLNNREWEVKSDSFLTSIPDVGNLVIGVHQISSNDVRPVYLKDVANIHDGAEEPVNYSRIGYSYYDQEYRGEKARPTVQPAVTLAIAKKKGTNAVIVAEDVLRKMKELEKSVLPAGVTYEVTRNYGETAQHKVNELLSSLLFAIITVVALMIYTMGWREALIVALAVPVSFSLSLMVNYLLGFTINRVTLFALILSLGLVVDDPITNVDSIQRNIRMGKTDPRTATLIGVGEVLPPLIMSTLAIIVSFLPLFFITGMMGPYMAPMAANVPLTIMFSLVSSLTIVPWLAYKTLKSRAPKSGERAQQDKSDVTPPWIRRLYSWALTPFLRARLLRVGLVLGIIIALIGCMALIGLRQIPVKMLPFDNKNEFQIVLDMPEGTPLEETDRVVRIFENYLYTVPEIKHFVSYVGRPSPLDFNGLVRHYYLRDAGNLADIRISLADKTRRAQQSHEILLRIRNDLTKIAQDQGATMKLVESPPGPPVISTLVAEVYGAPDKSYSNLIAAAKQVRVATEAEPFVVDTDDSTEAEHETIHFVLDKEKAALHGVNADQINAALRMALAGLNPASVHQPDERYPLVIRLTIPRGDRSGAMALAQVPLQSSTGSIVLLGELGRFVARSTEQPIYHKNLKRVVYVFGETAGRAPGEAVLDIQSRLKENPIPEGFNVDWAGEGEWQITLDVFRDLGIAFGAALIGIYILLIIETKSFFMPLLIMTAIPLTMLGIVPGFWLLNLFGAETIGGFNNPIFFTATSMIGMIALGGIVIRNSLVLINFVQNALAAGSSLKQAILDSGAVRFRPIVLTAGTTALGAWPITLDPIFSGLAWALIFGLFASTLFTLVLVPVMYYSINRKKIA